MIQYLFVTLLLLSSPSFDADFNIDNLFSTEISMKSKLNKDRDKLLIKIDLPQADDISFELYSRSGDIQHRWDEQALAAGKHDIALPLPSLSHTTYIVKMVGDKYELKQLLFNQ